MKLRVIPLNEFEHVFGDLLDRIADESRHELYDLLDHMTDVFATGLAAGDAAADVAVEVGRSFLD